MNESGRFNQYRCAHRYALYNNGRDMTRNRKKKKKSNIKVHIHKYSQ